MAQTFLAAAHDRDLTFFIGPVGAPPVEKGAYDAAVAKAEKGDSAALDAHLADRKWFLEFLADDDSYLKDFLELVVGEPIGAFSYSVSMGYLGGHSVPTLMIYLDRSMTACGRALGDVLTDQDAQCIASALGLFFKADWVQTVRVDGTAPLISTSN